MQIKCHLVIYNSTAKLLDLDGDITDGIHFIKIKFLNFIMKPLHHSMDEHFFR